MVSQSRSEGVRILGEKTVEIDLAQSQPEILGKLLVRQLGNNTFSSTVMHEDIYNYLEHHLNLKSRDKAKDVFYKMIFGKPYTYYESELFKLFPDIAEWVLKQKTTKNPNNPSKKVYSNVAYMLQRQESEIFRELWGKLNKQRIKFVPVHDSVIVREKDYLKTLRIFTNTMSKLLHYNISVNGS